MEKKDSNYNALTDEQKNFVEENFRELREAEMFEKISEMGPAVEHPAFAAALRETAEKIKAKVLAQEVSNEELSPTSGGICGVPGYCDDGAGNHCTLLNHRDIYEGGFPNCAATVEYSSWCGSNDACYTDQVVYESMQTKDCSKAWV